MARPERLGRGAAPHYDDGRAHARGAEGAEARAMARQLLREVGREFGVEGTFRRTPVGVYFGTAGTTVPDPYFGGEGPERSGCTFCGACMVGCREGAKNTLLKNYLWFAEKRGAEIMPEHEVVDIRPHRRAGRQRRLRGDDPAPGRVVPQAASELDRARHRDVGRERSAPTACWRSASSAVRCRASASASGNWCAPTASRSSP